MPGEPKANEFYSREKHEDVINKIADTNEFLEDLKGKDLTPKDLEAKRELEVEKQGWEEEHGRLMQRAFVEATRMNELFDYQKAAEAHHATERETYREAKVNFLKFLEGMPTSLKNCQHIEIAIGSTLPGVAEENLKAWTDGENVYFDLSLTYPEISTPHDPQFIEKTTTLTVLARDAEILNWEEAPYSLKNSSEGRALILKEIQGVIEQYRLSVTPYLKIDEDLVVPGTQEDGRTTPAAPRGEGLENTFNKFTATERFGIIQGYEPLFVTDNGELGAYRAFVFDDFILFDSLQYGNAVYFLRMDESITQEWQDKLTSIDEGEQEEAMKVILTKAGFYEEIRKPRSARRAAGNRVPAQHPSRPENADTDNGYKNKLVRYYKNVFDYIREGGASGEVPEFIEETT